MNLTDLRNQIETIAWGPRGTDSLQVATAHASPVMVICAAFQEMRDRTDLISFETETLRECCKMIRAYQFHGLAQDSLEVEANLPPPPAAPVITPPPEE